MQGAESEREHLLDCTAVIPDGVPTIAPVGRRLRSVQEESRSRAGRRSGVFCFSAGDAGGKEV